jgi:hypothetical protein
VKGLPGQDPDLAHAQAEVEAEVEAGGRNACLEAVDLESRLEPLPCRRRRTEFSRRLSQFNPGHKL